MWRPEWPCPASAILSQQRHGRADPTHLAGSDGSVWRALLSPEGPVSLRVVPRPGEGTVHATAWGKGSDWALAQVPALLGADDDVSNFDPGHPLVAEAWRRHPHLRFSASGIVMDSLLPAIIEQKVTGQEAFAGYRALVRDHGAPAPGPGAELGLRLQPTPEALRAVPSWEWLRLHVDPARSRTIARAAPLATSLERHARASGPDLERALRSVPGVGVWTAAEVRARTLGDADAVSFGDYHVAKDVGWALTGSPVDDAALAELLTPWAGHRGRVVALIRIHAGGRPRRGPRMAPRTHLPGRTPGR